MSFYSYFASRIFYIWWSL